MIELLISVLIICVVLWLAVWITSQVPMPPPLRGIILVIVGVALLLWFLRQAGVTLS